MQFYTNATIVQGFKDYINHLITHVNQYTGLSYAEGTLDALRAVQRQLAHWRTDPTIFAYETGNELGGPIFGDMWVPNEWTEEISSFVKSLAPHKLIVDGTYGVNKTHLSIDTVDIYSDHFYPLNDTKLQADIALVASANKTYLAGEYDWTGNVKTASSLSSFYSIIEAQQNQTEPVVAGDLFWSLFMHDVPNCNIYVNHSDGYTLQYGNPLNTVQNDTQISTIRQHFFRMQGQNVTSYLPAQACPGPTAEYTYL